MPDIAARYEFRVWRDRPDEIAARLQRESEHVEYRIGTETYFVSTATVAANPKARDGQLDIKVLRQEVDGFQQWDVHLKTAFPVAASLIGDELFPLLGLPAPTLERPQFSLDDLIDVVAAPHPDVAAVGVTKRRDLRRIAGCSAEITSAVIDGNAYSSVAIESTDLAALQAVRKRLGLDGEPNVSYPQAIRDRLGGRYAT